MSYSSLAWAHWLWRAQSFAHRFRYPYPSLALEAQSVHKHALKYVFGHYKHRSRKGVWQCRPLIIDLSQGGEAHPSLEIDVSPILLDVEMEFSAQTVC